MARLLTGIINDGNITRDKLYNNWFNTGTLEFSPKKTITKQSKIYNNPSTFIITVVSILFLFACCLILTKQLYAKKGANKALLNGLIL